MLGWAGRRITQQVASGILVAALGVLATRRHPGAGRATRSIFSGFAPVAGAAPTVEIESRPIHSVIGLSPRTCQMHEPPGEAMPPTAASASVTWRRAISAAPADAASWPPRAPRRPHHVGGHLERVELGHGEEGRPGNRSPASCFSTQRATPQLQWRIVFRAATARQRRISASPSRGYSLFC